MINFVNSAYEVKTGQGYGWKPAFEVFQRAVEIGDYAVVKAMIYGADRLIMPINVKKHLDELVKCAGSIASTKQRKNNMIKLLTKIASEA
ncbi:MAG: hypothetical protein ABFD50_07935 [Smithella sp.]